MFEGRSPDRGSAPDFFGTEVFGIYTRIKSLNVVSGRPVQPCVQEAYTFKPSQQRKASPKPHPYFISARADHSRNIGLSAHHHCIFCALDEINTVQ